MKVKVYHEDRTRPTRIVLGIIGLILFLIVTTMLNGCAPAPDSYRPTTNPQLDAEMFEIFASNSGVVYILRDYRASNTCYIFKDTIVCLD